MSHATPGDGRPATPSSAARIGRAVATAPIVIYQRVFSPVLPRRCKYEPTCSRYAVDSIGKYGILRGSVLALWRLLRCNPWSYGGYDPVEDQRLFKAGVGEAGEIRSRRAHGS